MSLSSAEVETAYRLILERPPSSEEAARIAARCDRLDALRQTLLSSEEFHLKFDRIRDGFLRQLKPVLIHLRIPAAMDRTLSETLASADGLQPAVPADRESYEELCARPRPERRELRYVHGDLDSGAGAALRLPYMHLCAIARPGPRLYRLYRMACAAEGEAAMSFGSYLRYSLESVPHRVELDNGQVRRLAGQRDTGSLGREHELLPRALHSALAPDMILGLFERPGPLIRRLAEKGFLSASEPPVSGAPDPQDAGYAAAVDGLSDDERGIFDAYTAWDSYLYDVCEGVLFSPAE